MTYTLGGQKAVNLFVVLISKLVQASYSFALSDTALRACNFYGTHDIIATICSLAGGRMLTISFCSEVISCCIWTSANSDGCHFHAVGIIFLQEVKQEVGGANGSGSPLSSSVHLHQIYSVLINDPILVLDGWGLP